MTSSSGIIPYKLIIGLICYGVFSMASFGILYASFMKQKEDAETINQAGKQRMLSQRIALGVIRKRLHLQLNESKFDEHQLIHDAELMRLHHLQLVHNKDHPDRDLSTALNTLYFSDHPPLYEKVLEFTKHAEWLAQVHSIEDYHRVNLELFSEQEVENLLGQLNDVVNQYEIEAQLKLENTKHLCMIIMCLHIGALLILHLICIRPAFSNKTD